MKQFHYIIFRAILIGVSFMYLSCNEEEVYKIQDNNSNPFFFKSNTQKWGEESNGLEYGVGTETTRAVKQKYIPLEGDSNAFLEVTTGEDFGSFKTLASVPETTTRAQCKDEIPTDNTFKIVAYYDEDGVEKPFFGKDNNNKDVVRDVAFHHTDESDPDNIINYWRLTGDDVVYWKMGSQAIYTYAWWPTNLSFNTTDRTFSYEVGTDPLNQTDFLYSYVKPTFYTVQESADIKFKHALTAVQFVMGQGFSASNGQTGAGKVVKIELKNLYYKGVFNPQTETWEVDKTVTRDFTLNIANPSEMTEEQQNIVLNPGEYTFLMLPQNLGDNPCEAIFTMADQRVFRASLNQAGLWEPGSAVRYRLAGDISNGYVAVAYSNEGVYTGKETGSISVCSYQLRGAKPYAQAWKVTGFSIDQGQTWNAPEATMWTGKNVASVEPWITNRNLSGCSTDENATGYTTVNLNMSKSVVTSRTGKGEEINKALKQNNKGTTRIDLSAYDAHGTALTKAESANSYVVSGYGYYKFPAAYGKALVGGSAASTAYNQSNFVNYKGVKISNPWVQTDTGVTPASVRIVWEERAIAGAIKNLSYDTSSKYVFFEVDKDKIYQGNAIIGLFDSNGTCMWSWHIWITSLYSDNPDLKCGSYLFTPEIYGIVYLGADLQYGNRSVMLRIQQVDNDGNVKIGTSSCKVMVSQGAGEENNMGIDCVYYQWGRKDPFMFFYNWSNPSSGTAGTSAPEGYLGYNDPSFNTSWTTGGSQISMADAIRHPNVFKWRDSNPSYDWNSVSYYNWWNSQATSSFNSSLSTYTKTVYDPSPPGYHVPNNYNFTGWSSIPGSYYNSVHGLNCLYATVTNASNKSVTVWLYAVGALNGGYRNNNAYFVTSQATDISSCRCFNIGPSGPTYAGGWVRCFGFPLIPVRDY